ncbi:hypothetical protein FOL46_002233 [Perkinsus olseni]|uniref:Uncharacterized protein n=1 Tax=Perkinsus olseni TaxID=32597 RepID=A0A7J6MUV7_PEROL|nr:hypothetical protein FOL46_002233 [Perkinsus olseni]
MSTRSSESNLEPQRGDSDPVKCTASVTLENFASLLTEGGFTSGPGRAGFQRLVGGCVQGLDESLNTAVTVVGAAIVKTTVEFQRCIEYSDRLGIGMAVIGRDRDIVALIPPTRTDILIACGIAYLCGTSSLLTDTHGRSSICVGITAYRKDVERNLVEAGVDTNAMPGDVGWPSVLPRSCLVAVYIMRVDSANGASTTDMNPSVLLTYQECGELVVRDASGKVTGVVSHLYYDVNKLKEAMFGYSLRCEGMLPSSYASVDNNETSVRNVEATSCPRPVCYEKTWLLVSDMSQPSLTNGSRNRRGCERSEVRRLALSMINMGQFASGSW